MLFASCRVILEVDLRKTGSLPDNLTVPPAGILTCSALRVITSFAFFEHGFLTQCLGPKCLLSRCLPHTTHIPGRLLAKLSYQTGGVLTGLWQKSDAVQSSAWNHGPTKWFSKLPFIRSLFSRLIGSLEHVADNSTIPCVQPTIFHRSLIATIQQSSLLSLFARLFQRCHLFRNGEA